MLAIIILISRCYILAWMKCWGNRDIGVLVNTLVISDHMEVLAERCVSTSVCSCALLLCLHYATQHMILFYCCAGLSHRYFTRLLQVIATGARWQSQNTKNLLGRQQRLDRCRRYVGEVSFHTQLQILGASYIFEIKR